jgi:hypothetical protein
MEKRFSREDLPASHLQNTSLNVSEEILNEAEKEGSAREFFFSLVSQLLNLKRSEIKKLNHEELIKKIVKGNGLEKFFLPSKSKNIYSALRKAFRQKRTFEVEAEWSRKLKNWREEFEEKLHVASTKYLMNVKSWELLKELYSEGWILPSYVVNSCLNRDFMKFISEISENADFLKARVENWIKLSPFKRREKIVRDIVKSYELNCLELGIYALFPLSEGVVWDTFVKENTLEADIEQLIRKRNRKFVTIQYAVRLLVERIFQEEKIPEFLDWIPFVDYRDGILNRHTIQHGVAVNFGTKENFIKLFLFVDFLAEIIGYLLNEI